MRRKAVCIIISKTHGQKAITLAKKLQIINEELKIQRDKKFIHIPLIRMPQENELEKFQKKFEDYKVSTQTFSAKPRPAPTFVELLEDELPPHLISSLPRAVDFVGDIAIIEVPNELKKYRSIIGKAILKVHKNVQTVLAKKGAVRGIYRLRDFSVIAGESKTETIHREYGCQYFVDLAKAYFSPRLSYEHKRIASLVEEGETIVDLFAGVGPFAVLIAKTHENVKVYAIDMNPQAVEFIKKNVRLNRVEGKIFPISGDARKIGKRRLSQVADRVIMNLPHDAMEFVDVTCEVLKPEGGLMHFYSFVNQSNSLENVRQQFVNIVNEHGRRVEEILLSRFVRATAPFEWQVVLDAKIC